MEGGMNESEPVGAPVIEKDGNVLGGKEQDPITSSPHPQKDTNNTSPTTTTTEKEENQPMTKAPLEENIAMLYEIGETLGR